MKPQIIRYQQNAWGITAIHLGGTRLQVRVAEIWQPEWWHCDKHPVVSQSQRCCWVERGREWRGIASMIVAGEMATDGGLKVWLGSVADKPCREAATGLLTDELVRLADAPVVMRRAD